MLATGGSGPLGTTLSSGQGTGQPILGIGPVSLPFDSLAFDIFHGVQSKRQLVRWLLELAHSRRPPDFLVLHLGENDLDPPMMSVAELMDLTVEDLHRISEMLPYTYPNRQGYAHL